MHATHAREAAEFRHPVEEMEPEEGRLTAYQQSARTGLSAFNQGLSKIIEAPCEETCPCRRAAYEVALVFGAAGALGDHTMTSIAEMFGLERAAISKEVTRFQQGTGLPESIYQKPDAETFRKARNRGLAQRPEEIS